MTNETVPFLFPRYALQGTALLVQAGLRSAAIHAGRMPLACSTICGRFSGLA